jgi:hypothetical protein
MGLHVKNRAKPLTIGLIALSLFVTANFYFSQVRLSELLNKVELTEEIAESTNSAFKINSTQELSGQCIRLGVIGRKYCGTDEWNQLVNGVIRPMILTGKDELQSERYFYEKTSLWPFGGEFEEAKVAYLEHIDAWIYFYERTGTCKTYECLISRWNEPNQINPTFLISGRLFREAVPMFDFKDSKVRIEEVFKE